MNLLRFQNLKIANTLGPEEVCDVTLKEKTTILEF